MKKFFIGFALFLVVIKLLDTICFQALSYFYKNTFVGQDGGDINKYLSDKNPPELVIMGSSTTRFEVNPDYFPVKSCNLARAMTTDCYQLGLVSLMIQHNKAPKNILLSLWPRNYLVVNKKDQHPEDILFLRYYYDRSDCVKNEINNVSFFERYKFLLASYRFNGMVTNTLKYYYLSRQQKDTGYYFKFQQSNPEDSINVINIKKLRSKGIPEKSLSLSPINTAYLARFIDTCIKHNINLMCYYLPRLEEDELLIKQGVDFMDKTLAEKKIPILKFNKENAGDLFGNAGYWVDGLHMNEKGGIVLSTLLSEFVKEHIK